MFYPRHIFSALKSEVDTKEMVVITGMRRVGKTTALRYLYDLVASNNKVFLDLENPLHRKAFEEPNYDAVWQNLRSFGISNETRAYLFLDEVQNLPEISRVAKYLYDHWDVKFFLTGSSSFYLKHLFPESLAGRKLIFEMYPLTFAEFLVFRSVDRPQKSSFAMKAAKKNRIEYERLRPFYLEYIEFGGFPGVVLEKDLNRKRQLLSEIFTSYFEKDAKNLADFKDMSKLRDLILLLVPRVGSRLEILKLAQALSVSRETVYNYLAFLEHTYFLSLLPRHSASIDRQAAGSRKLFLCDSGIAGVLGKPSQGQLLEQSVFQSLRPVHQLEFYNKDEGSEIDFIADKKTALEVKTHLSSRDISNLSHRSTSLGLNERYGITLNYTDESTAILVTDL